MSSTYQWAVQTIRARMSLATGYVADPFRPTTDLLRGLDRMRALLAELGNPQRNLRIVHVAGSKGKGSTSAFAASMLSASGQTTGLFTSPHLHSWRERIAIDAVNIPQDQFAGLVDEVMSAIPAVEERFENVGPVNAFELLLAMAMLHFRHEQCSFAVVEVGLGGRFDSTNVLDPEVTVITSLELEHVEILGQDLDSIAWNKGGIIKPRVPVVVTPQQPEALAVLEQIAASQHAPLLLGHRDWDWSSSGEYFRYCRDDFAFDNLSLGMPGRHQMENASAAITAVSLLEGSGFPIPETAIRNGLLAARLPGRFEQVSWHGRDFVLDGAHSTGSIAGLVDTLAARGKTGVTIIAGFLADKDIDALVSQLASAASHVYLTPLGSPRSASLETLTRTANGLPDRVTLASSLDVALSHAIASSVPTGTIVVTGSFSLVAAARVRLGIATSDS